MSGLQLSGGAWYSRFQFSVLQASDDKYLSTAFELTRLKPVRDDVEVGKTAIVKTPFHRRATVIRVCRLGLSAVKPPVKHPTGLGYDLREQKNHS